MKCGSLFRVIESVICGYYDRSELCHLHKNDVLLVVEDTDKFDTTTILTRFGKLRITICDEHFRRKYYLKAL